MRKQSSVKQQPQHLPTGRQRAAPKEEDGVAVMLETEAGDHRILIPRSMIGKSLLYYLESREG